MSNPESEFPLSPQSQAILARTTEIADHWKPLIYSGLFSDQSVPLLLALTENPTCIDVLDLCGIKPEAIDRNFSLIKDIIIKRAPGGLIEDMLPDENFIEDPDETVCDSTSNIQSILNQVNFQMREKWAVIEPTDLLAAILTGYDLRHGGRKFAAYALTTHELPVKHPAKLEYDLDKARLVQQEAQQLTEAINQHLGWK